MNKYKEEMLQLLQHQKKHTGYSEYGSKVTPAIKMYKELTNFQERKQFQDALEEMLCDCDEGVRKFAVDICLGFFVFRKSFE